LGVSLKLRFYFGTLAAVEPYFLLFWYIFLNLNIQIVFANDCKDDRDNVIMMSQ